MKVISLVCWLLAICICLAEAKTKIRRPLSPPYPPSLMLKKTRPIGHRISMGNNIHITGSLSHQRVPYKHLSYRFRRPTMLNVPSNNWKNQVPISASLNNRVISPQSTSVKKFHSINKVAEYSPEYKPESVVLSPTHRGGIDDDKGPIHTIPAPNLSPADKPYNQATNSKELADRIPHISTLNYHTAQNPMKTNFRLIAPISSSPLPQKALTSSTISQHQYEVTESSVGLKEREMSQSTTFRPQDIIKLPIIVNTHPQFNENRPVKSNTNIIATDLQFDQSSLPMQKNLYGSLHVGFPSNAIQTPYTIVQQIPDLHSASAIPPLSATQLYDLFNSFPQKPLTEQYMSAGQQHILQQQRIFRPDAVPSFSQPQMHSFNYDEQSNKLQQQQQQILFQQDYASESVTADYNFDPASPIDVHKQNEELRMNEEVIYPTNGTEQFENHIEYEKTSYQNNPTTYFNKISNKDTIPTKFYTTLPSREVAEKLAALAAAGNVNSQLIGQLRKQQKEKPKNDESIPFNHKNNDNESNQQQNNGDEQKQKHNQHESSHHKIQQHHRQNYKIQNSKKPSVQIKISDEDDYTNDDKQNNVRKDSTDMEYEYENEDIKIDDSQSSISFDGKMSHDDNYQLEFGSRLPVKPVNNK